jgi:hypothetical protein
MRDNKTPGRLAGVARACGCQPAVKRVDSNTLLGAYADLTWQATATAALLTIMAISFGGPAEPVLSSTTRHIA